MTFAENDAPETRSQAPQQSEQAPGVSATVPAPAKVPVVAIIGGGPGGLFSAWHLEAKAGTACEIVVLEASDRLGGKIITKQFAGAGLYEAGVAEIYGYSHLGPDPLRDLIEDELDLETQPIEGDGCVLDGHVISSVDDLAIHFGPEARDQAMAFRAKCAGLIDPATFYKSERVSDNAHPWAKMSAEELLEREISNEAARRYIRVMAHSDVAAPPHQTNGLNFQKNILMDVDGYINVYSVEGGNEEIVNRLVEELDAEIRLNSPVRSVEPLADGTYRIEIGINGARSTLVADYVILALPLTALSIMDWRSAALKRSINRHIDYFDRPGHYLRATLLFERPFWREHLSGAWWMSDHFDGCCVYDEGARHDFGSWGALGFLIAGNAALGLANMSDERIEELCLDSLPPEIAEEGRRLLVDRRVHRWMASVNAVPGGSPVRRRSENHRPDPINLPGVFIVGDYLFDSTLNGVLDSADCSTDMVLSNLLQRRRAEKHEAAGLIGKDTWPLGFNEQVLGGYFNGDFLKDMLAIAYDLQPGARVLHVGSGSGTIVAALRERGFDAHGIEPNRLAHAATPAGLAEFNRQGSLASIDYPDGYFDVVIETVLCHLPREQSAAAIVELKRVTNRGLILGSVTTDQTIDVIERHDLLAGVETLGSRWDWADEFFSVGFDHVMRDPSHLAQGWKRAEADGAGPGHWYEDAESLLFCFFELAKAKAANTELKGEALDAAQNDEILTPARSASL